MIAIDFDGTTKLHPDKVNRLFENPNNFIVIYTSRSNQIREQTELELASLKIRYHALVMEKIRADIYIDDKNEGGLKWPEF